MGEKTQYSQDTDIAEKLESELVVHNDEVNTFDYVINTLMRVCKHTNEQAQQCTLIIHFNGKCTVKSGPFEKLKPMCLALLDAGLQATID
ncbi:MAG: ATP-dependent Clp protease adaptor ClpS [Flavobacteriaceae bacterium]|jgi:ATP-dependent Clp protease adaptor protein ClpS|nr:ATP-dependent Clp protease adaptor ClpS [Flavobacteriaceae bacterium]MCI5088990.1 ATP-dependent Clp protease adaptor ClpS [Flavobacteriaceae bacterium]CAI8181404.1 MAG: ATP-dependent Clp protease adapter protein ClpS [SAR116 cluster bacterium]